MFAIVCNCCHMWPVLDLHVLSFHCSLYSLSLYSFLSSYREILLIDACSILNCTDTWISGFNSQFLPDLCFKFLVHPFFICVISFHFVSFRFISFHFVSFCFVSFHFVSFFVVSCRFLFFHMPIRTYLVFFVSFRFFSFRFF